MAKGYFTRREFLKASASVMAIGSLAGLSEFVEEKDTFVGGCIDELKDIEKKLSELKELTGETLDIVKRYNASRCGGDFYGLATSWRDI